jgi:MSHA biogenesis protein MshO
MALFQLIFMPTGVTIRMTALLAKSGLPSNQSGFTLIELVAVIVLLGIMSVFSYQFFEVGVGSYVDLTLRERMAQSGRFVVDRMSREIKNALPGSVRVQTNPANTLTCIEFIPVDVATGYVSIPYAVVGSTIVSADFDVTVLGGAASYNAAVFTLENCDVYGSTDLSCDENGDFSVDSLDQHWHPVSSWGAAVAGQRSITLATAVTFPQPSAARRLYFFSSPVAFCLASDGDLTRHSSYAFAYPHSFFTGNSAPNSGVLMGENIEYRTDAFVFSAGVRMRNGLVQLNLNFMNGPVASADESYPFNHSILMQNAP